MTPEYKLLIAYDILPEKQEAYYRYVLGEFVPALRTMGLHMVNAWHIAYGDYPSRQLEFSVESYDIWLKFNENPRWKRLEERLQNYTEMYSRKLIYYKTGFQF